MFFYPKTIETRRSKYNKEIKVVKLFGKYSLVVGKYTQSGGLVYSIWEKALNRTRKKVKAKKPKILILGLGAGSVAQIASAIWPQTKLTAIEIDKTMIELGKKYFNLSDVKNLDIKITDAIRWLNKSAKKSSQKKFDLIITDLYIGSNPPIEVQSNEFLQNIKSILGKNSFALFNRLIVKEKKKETLQFKQKLEHIFPKVKRIPTPANHVYLASIN